MLKGMNRMISETAAPLGLRVYKLKKRPPPHDEKDPHIENKGSL